MPQYVVLIYSDDSVHAPDATKEQLMECDEHFESLVSTGRMRLAYALTPRSHARSLRGDGVIEGPYRPEGHVVAGFYVLEAADIDEAVRLAGKDPSLLSGGGVEVRLVHSGGVVAQP
ncbi:YciI family protein [Microbacterium sp.]|uniref:YciI family protein n=1 Tax=Microbacterium sp. TaxID=51671 RepID=UPI0028AE21CF|nr:YciI family protein [Microbacterium sp.]